jgi:hypothetical protein
MAQITSKHRLFQALETGGTLRALANNDPILGSVQSVERESGSSKTWNVSGYGDRLHGNAAPKITVYVETVD